MAEPWSGWAGIDCIGWVASMLASAWLLLYLTRTQPPARLARWSAAAIPVIFVVAIASVLAMAAIGVAPPDGLERRFMAAVMSATVLAMLSFGTAAVAGMVETVTGFHQRYNPVSLHRFPIRLLVAHPERFRRGAAWLFFLGSGLMFYGLWLAPRN
jgi:hypothetical protein